MANVPMNSLELRKLSQLSRYYDDLDTHAVVVSCPGTFFFAGEKAILRDAPATCMKLPRRIYVSLFRSGNVPRLILKSSDVVIQRDDAGDFEAVSWNRREDLNLVLEGVAVAFAAACGRPLTHTYELTVLSEWQGDYGLGWSGAFAAALGTALCLAEGVVTASEVTAGN